MENLKLKHIAPYLPYCLHYMYKCEIRELVNLHYFYSHDEDGETAGKSDCTQLYDQKFGYIQCLITAIQPILRPLSDLTKEIEHEGQKFVPIDFIKNRCSSEDEFNYLKYIIDLKRWRELPYWLLSHFFEWHFDVFVLIDKGLAVDYNTVFPKSDVL